MQNRAQMKESKCAKDILKCAKEKRRLKHRQYKRQLIKTQMSHTLRRGHAKNLISYNIQISYTYAVIIMTTVFEQYLCRCLTVRTFCYTCNCKYVYDKYNIAFALKDY